MFHNLKKVFFLSLALFSGVSFAADTVVSNNLDFSNAAIHNIATISGRTTAPVTISTQNNQNIALSPNGTGVIQASTNLQFIGTSAIISTPDNAAATPTDINLQAGNGTGGNVAGANVNIYTGNGFGSADAGDMNVQLGSGASGGIGEGGSYAVNAGDGGSTGGNGGGITSSAGSGLAGSANGGINAMIAGSAFGSGLGGDIALTAGNSNTNSAGNVLLTPGTSSGGGSNGAIEFLGAVNASSNQIHNVANGTSSGDAVNLGQLQSTLIASTLTTVALNTATPVSIYTVPTGKSAQVLYYRVIGSTALTGSPTISIGTNAASYNNILSATSVQAVTSATGYFAPIPGIGTLATSGQQVFVLPNATDPTGVVKIQIYVQLF